MTIYTKYSQVRHLLVNKTLPYIQNGFNVKSTTEDIDRFDYLLEKNVGPVIVQIHIFIDDYDLSEHQLKQLPVTEDRYEAYAQITTLAILSKKHEFLSDSVIIDSLKQLPVKKDRYAAYAQIATLTSSSEKNEPVIIDSRPMYPLFYPFQHEMPHNAVKPDTFVFTFDFDEFKASKVRHTNRRTEFYRNKPEQINVSSAERQKVLKRLIAGQPGCGKKSLSGAVLKLYRDCFSRYYILNTKTNFYIEFWNVPEWKGRSFIVHDDCWEPNFN